MRDFNQNFENIPSAKQMSSKNKLILEKRKLVFLGILFVLILGILILMRLLFDFKKKVPSSPLPVVTPTPTLSEEVERQSFWATDSGILEIEKELKAIEKELDNTDIKEKGLLPPALDWKIEF